jgi:hypothetical protein
VTLGHSCPCGGWQSCYKSDVREKKMSVRGRVAWGLTVLWAGLGVAGAAFDMAYALRVPVDLSRGPTWVGESAGGMTLTMPST